MKTATLMIESMQRNGCANTIEALVEKDPRGLAFLGALLVLTDAQSDRMIFSVTAAMMAAAAALTLGLVARAEPRSA